MFDAKLWLSVLNIGIVSTCYVIHKNPLKWGRHAPSPDPAMVWAGSTCASGSGHPQPQAQTLSLKIVTQEIAMFNIFWAWWP